MDWQERLECFIASLMDDEPELLARIRADADESFVPIVRRETAQLLAVLARISGPADILEVGTGSGYSGILMLLNSPCGARLTSIESCRQRYEAAVKNFELAGLSGQARLICGDALEVLPELPGTYDLIFMDAAKGQYINFFEDIIRLLGPGGILISDNIFQDGTIIGSRYAIERRDRTIHKRMRDYLYTLEHTPGLTTALLNTGDGVALSVKDHGEAVH